MARNSLSSLRAQYQMNRISDTLVRAVVPDLTLQPPAQFTKTSIAKNMATAIRLTKSLPMAKNSPFSHYLASKGSTTWETAIKGRKADIEEDVIPAGWRILEKKEPAGDATDASKSVKQGGGIFSFWGRKHSRTSSIGSDHTDQTSLSPTRPPSVPPASVGDSSRRASQESVLSQTSLKDIPKSVTPVSEPPPSAPNVATVASPPSTPFSSSYADALDPHGDGSQPESPQPPASAVSRFLTRFSRKRSSLGTSSPRSSLALSSDDLDVLSDIVPSAQDGFDDEAAAIPRSSLSDILKAEPRPPTLPPPPTAAPVLRPQLPSITVRTAVDELVGLSSGMSLPAMPSGNNELHDLFGGFEGGEMSTRLDVSPQSAVSLVSAPSAAIGNMSRTLTPVSPLPSPLNSAQLESPSSAVSADVTLLSKALLQSATVPSPIRAETPSASTQAALRPDTTSGGRRLQPKVPLTFAIPPPTSVVTMPPPLSSSSSSSSRGEVPLAQLYPNAASNSRMAHLSASSARTPSPFVLDPPVRSRNHTPIMVDGPSKPTGRPPLLPPPPSFTGHSTVATPALNLFGDDDDDFADFQTSAQATPVTQPPTGLSTGIAPLPPPEGQVAPMPPNAIVPPISPPIQPFSFGVSSVPQTPQPLSSDPFNDEFSGIFSSSSSSVLNSHQSGNSTLNTSSASDKSLFAGRNGHSDFDGFVSSPSWSALRTPSPPRPPIKLGRPSLSVSLPRIAIDPTPQLSREQKTNQHQRTLSLLERAAARPGQWPAPPSPLPQALSFPIPGNVHQKPDFIGEDVDDSFGAFQSDTLAPSESGVSFLSPPAASSHTLPKSSGKDSNKLTISSASTQSFPADKSKSSGGLSAQDLSFFEGL